MSWETAHFTVSYSPVPDPSSPTGIGGVLVTAVETSERLKVEQALEFKTQELFEANRQLQHEQALYRSALAAGRMGTWETDLIAKTRLWTPEGMALFGINLPDGRGHVGGAQDEYWSALHPEDRHLTTKTHLRLSTGWFGRTAQLSGSGATDVLSLALRTEKLTA
jgi:PAS domain-containing protein